MAVINTNFSSAKSLEDLKTQLADAFRIVENLLSGNNTLSVRPSKSVPYPVGPKKGDVVVDQSSTPPILVTWDGKNWSALGGGTSTGGGATDAQVAAAVATYLTAHPPTPGESAYQIAEDNGFVGTAIAWLASLKGEPGIQGPPGVSQVGELIVADGVDNPPENLYNDIDGGDWLYADASLA